MILYLSKHERNSLLHHPASSQGHDVWITHVITVPVLQSEENIQ